MRVQDAWWCDIYLRAAGCVRLSVAIDHAHPLHVVILCSTNKQVAEFVGKEDAFVFNMGYATNSTVVPALMGPGSLIVSDSLNHVRTGEPSERGLGRIHSSTQTTQTVPVHSHSSTGPSVVAESNLLLGLHPDGTHGRHHLVDARTTN